MSTGRAGKKQLSVRASGGSGAGNVIVGQGLDRGQHLLVGSREQAEASASGQPATQEAASGGAGARPESLKATGDGKQRGKVRRDQADNNGRTHPQMKPGDAPGEPESKYGKDFKMPELPPLLQA